MQSVKFSEVSSPNPKQGKPTNEIDPKKWDDAKVQLRELLKVFGANKYQSNTCTIKSL